MEAAAEGAADGDEVSTAVAYPGNGRQGALLVLAEESAIGWALDGDCNNS